MKIQSIDNNIYKNPSFKAATINVNAFSDTHGNLSSANNAMEELRKNKKDVFCKEGKGKANILAVCGDWFMDGAKKGYLSNPNKENAIFQLEIFNEFINQIKGFASNTISLFTPGNHEFDGGVKLLDKVLSQLDAEVIISNIDIEKSTGFSESISANKIVNQKIIEVSDDKKPDLTHKVLFLGVAPVNMFAYQQNLENIEFIDNIKKSQAFVTKEDYQRTFDDCKTRIDKFKEENPDGLVILMNHTGVGFADNLATESHVDLVFDGHEHKDEIRYVNGTPIVPLSQNFQKLVNAKIKIDDEGKLENISLKSFAPLNNKEKGPLYKLYCLLFRKDIEPKYSIKADNSSLKELSIDDIRIGNNFLANFVTDSILEELHRKDDSIDFFALNSSAIRHPLNISEKPSISHFDIMNVLVGIKEDDGEIMTTNCSGMDIAYMVLDNVLFNKDMPKKNPLIHYAGLEIDKTKILEANKQGKPLSDMLDFIIDSRTQLPIESDKTYKIANVEKYFNKSQNPDIKRMKENSEFVGCKVQDLFNEHFDNENGNLYAKCDIRVK